MIRRILICLLAFASACWAQEHDHHDHDGHDHAGHDHGAEGGDDHAGHDHGGPPPEGWTFASLALTAGGGVLVSLALLAVFWKPIDAAVRRSRFRPRWEQRATRAMFGAIFVMLVAGIIGGYGYWKFGHHHPEEMDVEQAMLRPRFGGTAQKLGDYVVELLARRTGEVRFYLVPVEGSMPTKWELAPTITVPVVVPDGATRTVTNEVVQMKADPGGEYFVARTFPFPSRQIRVQLALTVKGESFEVQYDLTVRD
jgi:hypothetical protein